MHNYKQWYELGPPGWITEAYNNGNGKIYVDHYRYSLIFRDMLESNEYKNPADYFTKHGNKTIKQGYKHI